MKCLTALITILTAILLFFSISQARMYNPETGRYLSPDPIGLEGGLNLYTYTESNPANRIDPWGLLSQCRTGLDTIGGADIGPFHHEYQCWPGPAGQQVCRGYGRDPNSSKFGAIIGPVPGTIIKDEQNPSHGKQRCTPDNKNKCMDRCAQRQWDSLEKSIPQYGWIRGTECKAVQRRIYRVCQKECEPDSQKTNLPDLQFFW